MEFRKEKEYILFDGDKSPVRFIVSKVKTAEDNSFKEITYKVGDQTVTFKTTEIEGLVFIEPIDNVAIFTMYINWMNHLRPGIHQDLLFAEQVKKSIKQTLITRSYVKEGTGKFTDYDFNLLNKMFPSLSLTIFSLGC